MVHRTGLIISVKDKYDNLGMGEIAPLPGLHQETVSQVLEQIKLKLKFLVNKKLPTKFADVNEWFSNDMRSFYPSVQFGIECALLDLIAKRTKVNPEHLLFDVFNDTVHLNGLLIQFDKNTVELTKSLIEKGYNTIKIKVGRQKMAQEIERIRYLRNLCGSDIKLRLDANRSWTFAEAEKFGKAIADQNIDYIEEPLRNPSKLSEFYEQTDIPVAIDESLPLFENDQEKLFNGIKAVILKPSVLGSIFRTIKIAQDFKKKGIIPVITSVFESGLTLRLLVRLSAGLVPRNIAVGLDTFRWLKQDVVMQPFPVRDGRVKLAEIGNVKIYWEALSIK